MKNSNKKMPNPILVAALTLFVAMPVILLLRVKESMWEPSFTSYFFLALIAFSIVIYRSSGDKTKKFLKKLAVAVLICGISTVIVIYQVTRFSSVTSADVASAILSLIALAVTVIFYITTEAGLKALVSKAKKIRLINS